MAAILTGSFNLVPWLVSGILLLGAALLGWKIGVPAVKIGALEQRIKLLGYQLREAVDRAKLAEDLSEDLSRKLTQAIAELGVANRSIRSLLDTIELKQKLAELADTLQPKPK